MESRENGKDGEVKRHHEARNAPPAGDRHPDHVVPQRPATRLPRPTGGSRLPRRISVLQLAHLYQNAPAVPEKVRPPHSGGHRHLRRSSANQVECQPVHRWFSRRGALVGFHPHRAQGRNRSLAPSYTQPKNCRPAVLITYPHPLNLYKTFFL